MVVGIGGLGCPLLTYLTASGIGKIGIIDFDKVEISNLSRQTLFNYNDIGKFKVIQAKKAIKKIKFGQVNGHLFWQPLVLQLDWEIFGDFHTWLEQMVEELSSLFI